MTFVLHLTLEPKLYENSKFNYFLGLVFFYYYYSIKRIAARQSAEQEVISYVLQ